MDVNLRGLDEANLGFLDAHLAEGGLDRKGQGQAHRSCCTRIDNGSSDKLGLDAERRQLSEAQRERSESKWGGREREREQKSESQAEFSKKGGCAARD